MSKFERMVDRYNRGAVPWDDVLPPPEVMALAGTLPVGRALDLGCGYGRSTIYLARHGWLVDGVDFVPQAVAGAVARAEEAGVAARVQFHQAVVSRLDFLADSYDLALDVGCLHSLDEVEWRGYAAGLRRLLCQGSIYLLYARLRRPGVELENGPRGLLETAVRALFTDGFTLEKVEYGITQVEEQSAWDSAWFYFRRQSE